MAFVDNPIISALGAQLGLGGVFAAAGSPPAAATSAPAPAQAAPPAPGKSAANVPEYKGRPYIPKIETPANGTVGVRPGVNPITPGVMDSATLQDPNVKALLGQYGVTPPTTPPDPNLFVHNPAAFQNHPLAAGLLERGMEGLAYAHPGHNWFQSLIGGAQGMQEANAARAGQMNAQTMAPFQQAQQVAALQHLSDEHDTSDNNIAYHQGMLAHFAAADATKGQRIAAMPPRYNPKTGQPSYYQEDENGNPSWKADENWQEDPKTAITRGVYEAATRGLVQKYGSIENAPPDEAMKAMTQAESQLSLAHGAAAQAVANTRAGATTTAASIRANAPPRGARTSGGSTASNGNVRMQLQSLAQEERGLHSDIATGAQPGRAMADDKGNPVVGPSQKAAIIQKKQQRIAEIQQQRQALLGGSAPVAAPSAAPSAPAAKPAATWNPRTGRYE